MVVLNEKINTKCFTYEQLQNKLSGINQEYLYRVICRNVKQYRLMRHREFKRSYYGVSDINPYTTENIAALLGYNHTYYKRFESETDETKSIPLFKLFELSVILDVGIENFFKE